MTTLTKPHSPMLTPIVGSRFHPPSTLLLSILPAGTPLHLDPEPDNPYDPHAVAVICRPSQIYIPMDALDGLATEFARCGYSIPSLITSDEIKLGYLPADTNYKTRSNSWSTELSPSNSDVLRALAGSPNHHAELTFAPDGTALVHIHLEDPT